MIVAYVRQAELSVEDQAALDEKLDWARSAKAQIETLDGEDSVDAILNYANSHAITQLFIGHTQSRRKWPWSDPVEKLIRRSRGMDLRIFPQ
jgi:K+-sensing histidine kinase KdpD